MHFTPRTAPQGVYCHYHPVCWDPDWEVPHYAPCRVHGLPKILGRFQGGHFQGLPASIPQGTSSRMSEQNPTLACLEALSSRCGQRGKVGKVCTHLLLNMRHPTLHRVLRQHHSINRSPVGLQTNAVTPDASRPLSCVLLPTTACLPNVCPQVKTLTLCGSQQSSSVSTSRPTCHVQTSGGSAGPRPPAHQSHSPWSHAPNLISLRDSFNKPFSFPERREE